MEMNKVFKDPLYGYVRVKHELISDLIDCKEFQRLRRIKQLSGVSMVFHVAEHNRFSHSLGAYELAREVIEKVEDVNNRLSEYEQLVFLCSALLHDLGHGPYSHSFEQIFGIDHETMTTRIILGKTEVNEVLKRYNPQIAADIASVINHEGKFKLIEELVSSQLDVDRMDYLKRDAYFTGANFGDIDIEKILRGLLVKDEQIVFKVNSVPTIEDYLMSRYHMYYQVYFHPVSRCFEVILDKIYERWHQLINENYQFMVNIDLIKKVLNNKDDLESYIELDDVYVNGCIKQFQYDNDPVLKDLSKRFINRKLFKYIDLKFASEEEIKIVKQYKNNPKYYYKEDAVSKSAYDYTTDSQIKILLPSGKIVDLLSYSPIVEAFSKSSKATSRFIFYCEI